LSYPQKIVFGCPGAAFGHTIIHLLLVWREAVLLEQVVVEHSNCANAKLPIARVLMCPYSCRKVAGAFGIPLGSQLQNLSNSQKPESFVLHIECSRV
jgi:hypothetical protein